MYTATIAFAILSVIPQLNYAPQPVATTTSDSLAIFYTKPVKDEFPDRSKEAEIARQIDAQREQARLQAIEVQKQVSTPIQTKSVPQVATNVADDVYMQLAYCESGARWDYNGSSGFDGAFQFLPSTWNGMGTGYAFAYLAPPDVQIDAAKRLIARSGWGQFPACARKLGML